SGKRTDLPLPVDEPSGIGAMAFSPDGKFVYIATDSGGEFQRLALLELATGKYTWLTEDLAWDVEELAVDEKSGNVAIAINEDGASRLFLFEGDDPARQKRRELKFPLGIVSSLDFSPDGRELGMTLSLPDAPADVYSIRLDNGELVRWTFSEIGGLDPRGFVVPERIRFPSFDER